MAVSFDQIPANWRVPLVYAEIDPTGADRGPVEMPYKVLVIGQATEAGAPILQPRRCTSAGEVAKIFGAASLLAAQAEAWFAANTTTEVYFVAVPEPDGSKALAKLVLGGTATTGGVINLYIGDQLVTCYVPPTTTAAQAVTLLASAVNATGIWSASTKDDVVLVINPPSKGTAYNGVNVRIGYYPEQVIPEGLTYSFDGDAPALAGPTPTYKISAALAGLIAFNGNNDPARPFQTLTIDGFLPPVKGAVLGQFYGGSGVPDLMPLFDALGDDTWYHFMVSPWIDTATLVSLKEEAVRRFDALLDKPTHIICAAAGSHSELGTLGDSHNNPHLTILGVGGPFTKQENNLLLYDGISTYFVNPDGGCSVERLITTYKVNTWGAPDKAYLDLNTLLTLAYLRFSYKSWMAKVYPRHKLTDDDTNFGAGQAMVTPSMIKAETFAWFKAMEEIGLVENATAFKNELIVERSPTDVCRVNIVLPPNLVNQLRVLAVRISFRL
jgi:phage tail sheath gpL-like